MSHVDNLLEKGPRPTGVVYLRMAPSKHEKLKQAAEERNVTIKNLAVAIINDWLE